jgi:nucleotide-binding universal stress UspA family protein
VAGTPRVILHPTDFSERSEPALRVARELALEHGARLIVVHAVPFEYTTESVMLPVVTQAEREALDAARARADCPDLKYPVECRMMRGDAAPAILRAAEEEACDLLVLCTHGRTGLARVLVGSVAEAVLRKAPCPVLAVKAEAPPVAAAEVGGQACRQTAT